MNVKVCQVLITFAVCPELPKIDNAVVDTASKIIDTRLNSVYNYKCKKGFIQTGKISVGCIAGIAGPIWTPNENVCVSKYFKQLRQLVCPFRFHSLEKNNLVSILCL